MPLRHQDQSPVRGLVQVRASWTSAADMRDLSPVSSYANGELDPEERRIFFQLQARNRELRWQLGLAGEDMGAMPLVDAQVEEHLNRLRFAVSENARLRHDLVRLEETAAMVENGVDVPSEAEPSSMFPNANAPESSERERLAAAVMAEIQSVTQSNIEMISKYDERVKHVESELVLQRRRRQTAELELRMPSSLRSLSLQRSMGGEASQAGSWVAPPLVDPAQERASEAQQEELRQLDSQCERLSDELQQLNVNRHTFESRTLEELRMAHDIQVEELEHFRKLVQEKRTGAVDQLTVGTASNTAALLEAELEQLQEHLAQVKGKGDQERAASDGQADLLRQEARWLEQESENVKAQKEQCLQDLQEAKKSSWSSSVEADRKQEETRQKGEDLRKEVERTRRRVDMLDAKIEQLQLEASDIGQRADFVLRSLPPADATGGALPSPTSSGQAAELQVLLDERQAELSALRRVEQDLIVETEQAAEADSTARVEISVMEQRMKLLQNRLSSSSGLS